MSRSVPLGLAAAIGVFGVWINLLAPSDGIWFWGVLTLLVAAIVAQASIAAVSIKTARQAREDYAVLVRDQLGPIAYALEELAGKPLAHRAVQLEAVLATCLAMAVGVTEAHRVRATAFRIEAGAPHRAFVPWEGLTAGRGDAPQSRLFEGTPEGDEVWEAARNYQPRFCRDVSETPPVGWGNRKRAYRTFITAPIYTGKSLEGLLTINAPRPGDLSDDDVLTEQVIANLMGAAIGMSR